MSSKLKAKIPSGLEKILLGPIPDDVTNGQGALDGKAPETTGPSNQSLYQLEDQGSFPGATGPSQDADLPLGQQTLDNLTHADPPLGMAAQELADFKVAAQKKYWQEMAALVKGGKSKEGKAGLHIHS